jgi:RNA polymerase sigma-70 factor (ECF subfamily)
MLDRLSRGHPQSVSGATATARAVPDEAPDQRSVELTALFQAQLDFVWRVLRRLGVIESEIEDSVQEVFLVVAHKLHDYEERGALRAWLFAIARQVASHARRADQRRRRRDQLSEPPAAFIDPQQSAERREAVALVERFLGQLDEGQAMVFFLSELEGLSAPEIAAALELELSTVYGRQRLARRRFAQFVRRHGPGGGP